MVHGRLQMGSEQFSQHDRAHSGNGGGFAPRQLRRCEPVFDMAQCGRERSGQPARRRKLSRCLGKQPEYQPSEQGIVGLAFLPHCPPDIFESASEPFGMRRMELRQARGKHTLQQVPQKTVHFQQDEITFQHFFLQIDFSAYGVVQIVDAERIRFTPDPVAVRIQKIFAAGNDHRQHDVRPAYIDRPPAGIDPGMAERMDPDPRKTGLIFRIVQQIILPVILGRGISFLHGADFLFCFFYFFFYC